MDLTTTEGIKQFYDDISVPRKEQLGDWNSGYLGLAKEVADATPEEISDKAMQLKLWEDKSISGSGMCSIPMSDFATNKDSVDFLRSFVSGVLPEEREANRPDRIEPRANKRRPKLLQLLAKPRAIAKRVLIAAA